MQGKFVSFSPIIGQFDRTALFSEVKSQIFFSGHQENEGLDPALVLGNANIGSAHVRVPGKGSGSHPAPTRVSGEQESERKNGRRRACPRFAPKRSAVRVASSHTVTATHAQC